MRQQCEGKVTECTARATIGINVMQLLDKSYRLDYNTKTSDNTGRHHNKRRP